MSLDFDVYMHREHDQEFQTERNCFINLKTSKQIKEDCQKCIEDSGKFFWTGVDILKEILGESELLAKIVKERKSNEERLLGIINNYFANGQKTLSDGQMEHFEEFFRNYLMGLYTTELFYHFNRVQIAQ